MSGQTIRILKEARILFWPWVIVLSIGLFRLAAITFGFNPAPAEASIPAFYIGFPVLAVLSLGSEFQQRTLAGLLAQPVDRLQVWKEKQSVLLVAVLSAYVVYYAGWHTFLEQNYVAWFFAAAFPIATIASATFWTLFARSTLGGLALNIAVQGLVVGAPILIAEDVYRMTQAAERLNILLIGLVAIICYSALMAWLGARKLVRFQVTGEGGITDVLVGPKIIPDSWARWLTWHPTGAMATLLKKEFRLLRPVWLVLVLSLGLLLALGAFGFFFHIDDKRIKTIGEIIIGVNIFLTTILIGSVSVGEERQLGTHSWNLTLPIAAWRQWLLKIVTNAFANIICVICLIGMGYLVLGPAFRADLEVSLGWVGIVQLSLLALATFPAFWSACATNGTIRAAVWVFPIMAAVEALAFAGSSIGELQATKKAIDWVVLTAHPYPPALGLRYDTGARVVVPVLAIPILVLAAVQSYRLFRTERLDSFRPVLRYLIPLGIVAFCLTLTLQVFLYSSSVPYRQMSIVFFQTIKAIERLGIDPTKLDEAHPQPVTVQDLERVLPLSEITRRWLANASISVSPKPRKTFRGLRNGVWREIMVPYSINLHFSQSWNCRIYDAFISCNTPDGRHWGVLDF